MRVAFVVPRLRIESGWRSMAAGAIRSLAAAGVEPIIVVARADIESAKNLFDTRCLYALAETQHLSVSHPWRWPATLSAYRAASRFAEPIDLVHSLEAYPTGLAGSWIARARGVPHVISAVGTYSVKWAQSRLESRYYRRTLTEAAAICAISDATATAVQRYSGAALDRARFQTVLLGTDFARRVPRVVAEQRRRTGAPVVLSVGAVKPRKGYHDSIAAFALVQQRWPDAEYWIVGSLSDRRYVDSLRRLVEGNGLRVRFLGAIDAEALDSAYRRAWLFLLAPVQSGMTFEGFGLVYLEAGAFGLPVVGTDSGGVPQAVHHEETGILVASGDIAAIANAVAVLIADENRARTLGMNNRARSEVLTWDRYAAEQRSLYENVLAQNPAASTVLTPG